MVAGKFKWELQGYRYPLRVFAICSLLHQMTQMISAKLWNRGKIPGSILLVDRMPNDILTTPAHPPNPCSGLGALFPNSLRVRVRQAMSMSAEPANHRPT